MRDDLDFVSEVVGEEGTQRSINKTGGENFILRRPAFSFYEAAGDLAAAKESSR